MDEGFAQEADVHVLLDAKGGLLDHEPGGGVAGSHLQGVLVGENPNQEQHQRGSHHVQGGAAHGLVRLQVDGGEGQEQGEYRAHGSGNQHGEDFQPLQGQPVAASGSLVEYVKALHGAHEQHANKRSEDHNAFQCQVDDTAALGEDTGQGHNHQGHRVQKGLLNQKTHACAPPSLVVLGSLMGGSALALVSPLRGLPVIMARITREKALR